MRPFLILVFLLSPGARSASAASPRQGAPPASAEPDAFQKGLSALQAKDFDGALSQLTIAESEHPKDPRVRNFRGIVLAQLRRNAEAADEYATAIRLDPRREDAYRNLGFLKWTMGDEAAARSALEQAVKLAPADGFAHYYLARLELGEHRYAPALREMERSGMAMPADFDFLKELTIGYVTLGREADARKSLVELQKLNLDEGQSLQTAELLLQVHQTDSAIRIFQRWRDAKPQRETLEQYDLARAYLADGNYQQAVQEARIYLDSAIPGETPLESAPHAWSVIGIAYARLDQREPCIHALRRAATLAPQEEEYWLNLTRELMEFARYPEAIAAVQNALAATPHSYALNLRLGAAYLAAGQYPQAENVFRDLVNAGDPLPTGYVGLAQVLLRTGRADEAASELAAAEQKLGPQFLLSYFRGLALDRSGKSSPALSAFQDAVKLNPKSVEAHLNVGKTKFALGRAKEAIAEFQQVLRLDPANVQAKRLLSQAYHRAGDEDHARKAAEASASAPAPSTEGDLLGDLFMPAWVIPVRPKSRD